jgi:DNA modification methylase
MKKQTSTQEIQWLPTSRTCNCPVDAINCLSERQWLRNQVPIWWFGSHELNTRFDSISRQNHPATFSSALAKRVIRNYSHENDTVLDIFSGVGTTLYASRFLKRNCIGFELSKNYSNFTSDRLGLKNDEHCTTDSMTHRISKPGQHIQLVNTDCKHLEKYIKKNSIDLVFSSPPYWDLLKQPPSKRNLRNKKYLKNNYSDDEADISNDKSLKEFINDIKIIFGLVHDVLSFGKHCIINTADYRRQGKYISLSGVYINELQNLGFELKNVIILDRRAEYDIGIFSYPKNFIVNNGMFEYILDFKK